MSQQSFFRMLYTPDSRQWSKLESFLASSVLIRHFHRAASEPSDPNNPTVNSLHQSFLKLSSSFKVSTLR